MKLINKYFPKLNFVQLSQLNTYQELLKEWNQKINLISRKDMEYFEEHHLLHALSLGKLFTFPANYKILDVGTGGGLPGIPLAILFPESNFTLIDSIGKKINVVSNIIREIGLNNVQAVNSRVEDVEDKFDLIIARAVTSFPKFYQLCHSKLNIKDADKSIHGILYLKGGFFFDELISFKKVEIYNISDLFEEEFFKEKKIIYLPK